MSYIQQGYEIPLENVLDSDKSPRGGSQSKFSWYISKIYAVFALAVIVVFVLAITASIVALVFSIISYDDTKDTEDSLSKTKQSVGCMLCLDNGVAQFENGIVAGIPSPTTKKRDIDALEATKAMNRLYGGLAVLGNITTDLTVVAPQVVTNRVDAEEIYLPGRGVTPPFSVGPRVLALTSSVQTIEVQISRIDTCSCDEVDSKIAAASSILQAEIDILINEVNNITVYSNTTVLKAELTALEISTAAQFAAQGAAIASLQGQLTSLEEELGNSTLSLQSEINSLNATLIALQALQNSTAQTLQTEIDSLTLSISALQNYLSANISSLQGQITQLGANVTVLSATVTTLQSQLSGNISVLQLQLTDLSIRIDSLNSSFIVLNNFVMNTFYPAFTAAVTNINASVNALSSSVSVLRTDLTTLNTTVTNCCANRVSSLTAGQGMVVSAATGSVTVYAANISTTNRLLGRAAAGAGPTQEITLGTTLSISGTTLNSIAPATNNYAAAGVLSWAINTTLQLVPITMLYQTVGGVTFNDASKQFTVANAGVYVILWSMARREAAHNFAIRCYVRDVTGGGVAIPYSNAGNGDGQFSNFDRPFNGPFGTSVLRPLAANSVLQMECLSLYIGSNSATFYNAYMMVYRIG
jgi:prefoldin subunit 5